MRCRTGLEISSHVIVPLHRMVHGVIICVASLPGRETADRVLASAGLEAIQQVQRYRIGVVRPDALGLCGPAPFRLCTVII